MAYDTWTWRRDQRRLLGELMQDVEEIEVQCADLHNKLAALVANEPPLPPEPMSSPNVNLLLDAAGKIGIGPRAPERHTEVGHD